MGEPFYLGGRATAVHYTAGGNALLVGSIEDTKVTCYNTKTPDSPYLPLPHPKGVSQITSNADGSVVITVTIDGIARLCRIPTTDEPPPKWLPDYLNALSGLTFSSQQRLAEVPMRKRVELREKLLSQPPENTIWDKLMRWSFGQKRSAAPDPEY